MARKQKTIHYLYKTICLVTKRYYIGMHSTYNLNDGYMGSGKRLRRSIRKHGIVNHKKEIIEFFESRELLIEAEIKAITPEMITDKNCMNIMGGGIGGFINEKHIIKLHKGASKWLSKKWKDKVFKDKISKLLINYTNENHKLGKIKPPDWNGKQHSDETKVLMSEQRKDTGVGKTNSQYGTCWINKDGLNKKIKKEDLISFINDDWIKGRKMDN